MMRRGTTPTNTFNVDVDLQGATVYVTYQQDGKTILEKTGNNLTISANSIVCELSQEDTLAFNPGAVEIQIRYVKSNGFADASNIIRTTLARILKDGEITYV